eukprot:Protomagalhaensia_wolfi_Nauph_80__5122@NODE_546_length_2331_cov_7901_456370_g406_i0_p2_GENE_NODE_546_length_2331_cov_7901_456370_g406_i0NODE_546_length_2331_cov_7901_456370_g406_i0_p2_ORF_typecomplete_len201_score35_42DnaT/PF17948_1/0_33_NODE_546_length_2331_cov_7901_456370_g406_i010241626
MRFISAVPVVLALLSRGEDVLTIIENTCLPECPLKTDPATDPSPLPSLQSFLDCVEETANVTTPCRLQSQFIQEAIPNFINYWAFFTSYTLTETNLPGPILVQTTAYMHAPDASTVQDCSVWLGTTPSTGVVCAEIEDAKVQLDHIASLCAAFGGPYCTTGSIIKATSTLTYDHVPITLPASAASMFSTIPLIGTILYTI